MLVAAGLLAAHAAGADVLDDVNGARLRGCRSASPGALLESPSLKKAAGILSRGAQLHDALESANYRASQSAVLHFSGEMSDADITHALTANYCRAVTDANFREVGIERRGRELWIVLAAPVKLLGSADASSASRQILDLVNAARAGGRRCGAKYFAPAPPLALEVHLASAALAHSRDMAQGDAFDHRGRDGSSPAERVERAGYGAHSIVGENIAAGAMSPAEATQGWLESPAHCENIMDPRFVHIGIAFASNPKSEIGTYWTQDFAAPLR